MADQIISPTAPAPIAVQSPNGQSDQPFNGMEEMLSKVTAAFDEARPDPFKKKTPTTAPIRESAKPAGDTEQSEESDELHQPSKAVDNPVGAPSETKAPAKAAQWKEVNEERARLKAENETFKTEREKWKTWETERKEYDTIKRHNTELLDRIQAIAVEKDPRFENYFKGKTDTAIALAKQAVGDGHSERVSKLLQLPDTDFRTAQLEEVMAELGPTRQARLGAAIVEMDRIHLEKSTALSKSKENWEAMQKADRDQKQGKAQEFERTFQDTLERWSNKENGLPLFQMKDGDEAHNAEVKQRIETARNILTLNLSADQLSKAALWSSAAPGLLKNQMALSEENKALKAELEALKAGGPDLKGANQEQAEIDDEKQYEGMSMGQIIAIKAEKAGGFQR